MLNKFAMKSSKDTMKILSRQSVKNFSSATKETEATTETMAQRFHEIYIKELDKLHKTSSALITAKYKVKHDRFPTEAKFPVYWSNHNLSTYMMEAIGTEPVSPHYESFSRSRKYPILMAGTIYLLTTLQNINLNSLYGQHAVYQFYTLIGFGIGIFEMRYVLQKLPAPRATWFYDAFIEHEFRQMGNSWQDVIEEKSKKFLALSKEQIDYYLIHKEFSYIKKRSLSTYLDSEKQNLQKHFYDRTLSMLKTVENLENNNIRNKVKQIAEDAMKNLITKTSDVNERKAIHNSAFTSALEGLRTGIMTYTNDPLLPLFVNEVTSNLQPLKKLTKLEENNMFALTADQKKFLVDGDNRAKIEYLSAIPNVTSAAVKNTDVFRSITNRMKRRIEANFKL